MKVNIDSRLKDLVPSFISRKKTELNELTQLIEDKEFEKLRLFARSLAWSAPGYGFIELGLAARKLELDATNRKVEMMKYYQESMIQYLQTLDVEYVELRLEA